MFNIYRLANWPMVLESIVLATLVVSAISLIGVVTLSVQDKLLHRLLPLLVALAAGAMLATAFFDLLPDAIRSDGVAQSMPLVLVGIVFFLLIERFLHWHHHHKHHHVSDKKECPVGWLSLIGSTLHNFIDGTIIAAGFIVSPQIGFLTTISIITHEIPHEIGDFSLLIWGGFSKRKAIFFNFLSALASLAGGVLTFFVASFVPGLTAVLLPLAAGQFIYIACVDLAPEMHKENNSRRSVEQLAAFGFGIAMIVVMSQLLP